MPSNEKSGFRPSLELSPWVWAVYFLLLWQILLRAQNPGLMSDDSGEMAAAAYNLGLAHPPGYPFFGLMGHLVVLIPVGTMAFRLNLFSAALTLFSLFLTLDAARNLDFSRRNPGRATADWAQEVLLAALGVVFISFRGVFAQSLTAKGCVYTLTLFWATAAVWLYVFQQRHPEDDRPWWAICLLWAVGLANHWQTMVLWVPFLTFWSLQRRQQRRGKKLLLGSTLVFIGISPYLYLPFRARLDCEPCWGYPINLPLFDWVVSRQLVAGVEHWIQTGAFYLESAKEIARAGFMDWLPGFMIVSLIGVVVLRKKDRSLVYGFLALFLPVLMGVFAVHEEYNTHLIPCYLVSLSGLAVLFGFVALRSLQTSLPHPQEAVILAGLLGLAAGVWLAHVFQAEDKSRYTLAEDFGTNVLMGLPRGAVLLADGDHYVMPIWYERYAQGKRPDVVFEPSVFLYHGWGWKQLIDQSADLKPVESSPLFQERLDALARVGPAHPLFYSLGREFLEPALEKMPGAWVPRGLVYAWELHRPFPLEVSRRVFQVLGKERLRGWEGFQMDLRRDLSTEQIYRYYAEQLSVLKQ